MTYTFESGLARHIEGLIQQKRADGYAYNCEEKLLKRLDTFCVQNSGNIFVCTTIILPGNAIYFPQR